MLPPSRPARAPRTHFHACHFTSRALALHPIDGCSACGPLVGVLMGKRNAGRGIIIVRQRAAFALSQPLKGRCLWRVRLSRWAGAALAHLTLKCQPWGTSVYISGSAKFLPHCSALSIFQ